MRDRAAVVLGLCAVAAVLFVAEMTTESEGLVSHLEAKVAPMDKAASIYQSNYEAPIETSQQEVEDGADDVFDMLLQVPQKEEKSSEGALIAKTHALAIKASRAAEVERLQGEFELIQAPWEHKADPAGNNDEDPPWDQDAPWQKKTKKSKKKPAAKAKKAKKAKAKKAKKKMATFMGVLKKGDTAKHITKGKVKSKKDVKKEIKHLVKEHLIHHKKELMHNKKAVKKAKKMAKKKLSKEEIAGMKKVKKAIDVWGQQKNIDARIAAAERDDKSKARKKEARKIKDKAAMKAGIKKLAAKAKKAAKK